jgi:hypothetical protein
MWIWGTDAWEQVNVQVAHMCNDCTDVDINQIFQPLAGIYPLRLFLLMADRWCQPHVLGYSPSASAWAR